MHATALFHSPCRHSSQRTRVAPLTVRYFDAAHMDVTTILIVGGETWFVPRTRERAVWVRVLHGWNHFVVFLGHNGVTNSEVITTFLLLCCSGYFVSNIASLFVGQRQELSNEALPNSIRSLPITR